MNIHLGAWPAGCATLGSWDRLRGCTSCAQRKQFLFCVLGWQDVQPQAGSRPHIVRSWEGLCRDEWTFLRQGLGAVIWGAQISLPPTCQGLWNSIDKNSSIILSRSLPPFKKTNTSCVNNWRLFLSSGGPSSFVVLSLGETLQPSQGWSLLLTFFFLSFFFLRLSCHLLSVSHPLHSSFI